MVTTGYIQKTALTPGAHAGHTTGVPVTKWLVILPKGDTATYMESGVADKPYLVDRSSIPKAAPSFVNPHDALFGIPVYDMEKEEKR